MKKMTSPIGWLIIGLVIGCSSMYFYLKHENQKTTEKTQVHVHDSKVFISSALMVINEKGIIRIILPKTSEKDLRIVHDAMFSKEENFQYPNDKKGCCINTYKLTEYFFDTE